MLKEHARFIETASEEQLQATRTRLQKLLPILREPEVRRDTQQLLRSIDQEMLDRVMREARQGIQGQVVLPAAKAA
ncbi:hypothetical protein os4_35560 (plasmid) [Comamonadaceae bacterium OS-4]|nr:hypothetical protein os4_35560 [Comamonadaceae bacterium OS-4]